MPLRLRRNHDGFAFGQDCGPGCGVGITGTEMLVILKLSLQEAFRIGGSDPAAFFGDSDGDDFVFVFIDGVEDRRGRKQRDLMLSAAPAEQDANSKFFHDLSVWTRGRFAVKFPA